MKGEQFFALLNLALGNFQHVTVIVHLKFQGLQWLLLRKRMFFVSFFIFWKLQSDAEQSILTGVGTMGGPEICIEILCWPGWWTLISLACTSILYPGGKNVLKPTMRSGWPLNSWDTRFITPGVSILEWRKTNKLNYLTVYGVMQKSEYINI